MPPTAKTPPRPRLAPLPMARWAQWFVALAALVLMAVSLGSYYYHRRQMDSIAAQHLRLIVVGPRQLQPGAPAVFHLLTTRVTGEPCAVPVQWSLSTADGKLIDRKEPTDEEGRLTMTVPADMALPIRSNATAELIVTAGGSGNAANTTLPLALRPAPCTLQLETDRASYRPGDTLYYRSLTLSPYGPVAERTLPLEFQILDAKGAVVPDSVWIGLTDRGVGNGSFRLPVALAAGSYTLSARSADPAVAEQRLAFEVTGPTASASDTKTATKRTADKKAVKIAEPKSTAAAPLPSATPEQKVAMTVEPAVIAPAGPVELSLRVAEENLPLVVAVSCGDVLLGQQLLIASPKAAKGMTATIPLNDRTAGALCVSVYDCSPSPPKIVAQQLVVRQPQPLVVRAVPSLKGSDDLLLAVESEKGRPVAAALSVTAFRGDCPDLCGVPAQRGGNHGTVPLATTHSSRRSPSSLPDGLPGKVAADHAAAPMIYDNLDELRTRYQAMLDEYRAQRTHLINALIMLGFFGGLALALLVTMLALLRIVWGGQLWLPTVVATLCCVIVTAVSNDPSRMEPVEMAAVRFAALPDFVAGSAPPAAPAADSLLGRLAEKLARFPGDAAELKADRFPVQQYAAFAAGSDPAAVAGKPLAWYPLLIADKDGRVRVPGVPASAKGIRLLIEVHADGRLGSCELPLK